MYVSRSANVNPPLTYDLYSVNVTKKQTMHGEYGWQKLGEDFGTEGLYLFRALCELKWIPVTEIMDSLKYVFPSCYVIGNDDTHMPLESITKRIEGLTALDAFSSPRRSLA